MGVRLKNTVYGMALVPGCDRQHREILHWPRGVCGLMGVKERGSMKEQVDGVDKV